jgi:hypothetical protein
METKRQIKKRIQRIEDYLLDLPFMVAPLKYKKEQIERYEIELQLLRTALFA